jgi:hypothetical protein
MTYRQWLQQLSNAGNIEANALLKVVGDDLRIDDRFMADPYAFTGNDRGQVFTDLEPVGSGNNMGYGPQGMSDINEKLSAQYRQVAPSSTNTTTSSGDGGAAAREAERLAKEAQERQALRGEISGFGGTIDELYEALFADLDNLVKARGTELEGQYGEQFDKASRQYAGAIPEIETSYASLGAADSTDNTYAKNSAKEGFEDTTKTIGKNKEEDKAKLGQYALGESAKFEQDRNLARSNVGRAEQTEDLGALRGMRNDLEKGVASANVARATLGTDEGAKGEVVRRTADAGRFEAAQSALDAILKSSLAGSVKQAAVKAISDNSGLSKEDRERVTQMYGDVYKEQAAL